MNPFLAASCAIGQQAATQSKDSHLAIPDRPGFGVQLEVEINAAALKDGYPHHNHCGCNPHRLRAHGQSHKSYSDLGR